MTPEYYANCTANFANYMRTFGGTHPFLMPAVRTGTTCDGRAAC